MGPGGVQFAAQCQRDEHIEFGIDKITVTLQRGVKMADSIVKLLQLKTGQSQIAMRCCRMRVKLKAALVEFDTFQDVAAFHLYKAEVAQRIGEVRFDLERACIAVRGFLPPFKPPVTDAEIVLRLGTVRTGGNRPAACINSVFKPLQADQAQGHRIQ